jgi:hypothetical protein
MKNGNGKNNKLLILENDTKWNTLMNYLSKCSKEEELGILKQIDKINEELRLIKEIK